MIESATINGRPALVSYVDEKFDPVEDRDRATLVKVIFTDKKGGVLFLTPPAKAD